jgi:hypothetical protein
MRWSHLPLADEDVDDDEATRILADVINRMSPGPMLDRQIVL